MYMLIELNEGAHFNDRTRHTTFVFMDWNQKFFFVCTNITIFKALQSPWLFKESKPLLNLKFIDKDTVIIF
jgi:hypothetical protein